MNTITSNPNQTMADLILMSAGTMEAGMQVMAENNKSISGVPATGDTLNLPVEMPVNTEILKYLAQNDIVIGTCGH